MDSKGQQNSNQEIAYWILGIAGVLVLQRLWAVRARPWLKETVPALKDGKRIDVAGLTTVSLVDLVVWAVLMLAVLVIVAVLRSSVRSRRRRRELEAQRSS